LLIQSGGAETLRDEGTLLAHRASTAGVDVTHEVFDSGIHVCQAFVKTEASAAALLAMGRWAAALREKLEVVKLNEVDELLRGAWEQREAKIDPSRRKEVVVEAVIPSPKFLFEGVVREAPKVEAREAANEKIRKAVEEAERGERKNVTTIYVARRNPDAEGIVRKVWGAVHL
jgi:hypothetical protein